MSSVTNDRTENQGQILMLLGELKGGMAAIQNFLALHQERMDRADARVDGIEEKIGANQEHLHARISKQAEHFEARLAEHAREDSEERGKLAARISKIELRITAILGGGAVVLWLLDKFGVPFLKATMGG